jgi:hypothetical protein
VQVPGHIRGGTRPALIPQGSRARTAYRRALSCDLAG